MEHFKQLNEEQKVAVSANNLNPNSWKLIEQTEFYLKICHKTLGIRKRVDRYAIPKSKKGVKKMDYSTITVQDCIDMYKFKNKVTIIKNGQVIGFQDEKILTPTANQNEDR